MLFSSCHRLGKGKYEDGDSINLNDIEKVLPVWQVGDEDICPCHGGDQQQHLPCLVFPYETLLRSGKAAGLWSSGGWDGDLCLFFQVLVLGKGSDHASFVGR